MPQSRSDREVKLTFHWRLLQDFLNINTLSNQVRGMAYYAAHSLSAPLSNKSTSASDLSRPSRAFPLLILSKTSVPTRDFNAKAGWVFSLAATSL